MLMCAKTTCESFQPQTKQNMEKRRYGIVITSNPLNHEGGMVAFCNALLKGFMALEYDLCHHPLGSRMELFYSPLARRLLYPAFYVVDIIRLAILLLRKRRVRIVQVNPSLIPVPLIRDGLVILLARLLGRQVVVLFHGWKHDVVKKLRRSRSARFLFDAVFCRASVTLVLANRFKEDLVDLGWEPCSIEVTSTMYEADLVLPAADRSGQRPRFLFLGRISELKGVGELVDAARLLAERGVDFECVLVGHGDRAGVVEALQARVVEEGIADRVRFAGRLTGRDKYRAYAESDVYVFPSWTEGCPTSVLEALGSGLFVISTDVGALRDIIREGENGRIVRVKDHEHLAELMAWAAENIEEIRSRRARVQRDAEAAYEARVVVRQFAHIYDRLLNRGSATESGHAEA